MDPIAKKSNRPIILVIAGLFILTAGLGLSAQASSGGTTKGMMSGPAAAPAPAPSIDGIIASIEGSTLVLTGANGDVNRVQIEPDTLILGRESASLESIMPGDAMGVAATREQDGSLTATVINVFSPELWKKVRKGQWPMASGQVMTNAQVDHIAKKVEGRTLFLHYEMLDAAIQVPPSAEIRRSVTRELADLKVGARVSVRLAAQGSDRAAMISLDQAKS